MSDRFEQLERVTGLILDRELSTLRESALAAAARRIRLDQLTQARAARAQALAQGGACDDLASLTGRDALWQAWVQRERAMLQAELATSLAELEENRLAARRAFGRAEAMRRLREAEASRRRTQSARRFADRGE